MKSVFFTLVLMFAGAFAFAQADNSLSFLNSGEYAFYLDKRGDRTFYRGYMYFPVSDGNRVLFARSIDAQTGQQENFMFTVNDDNNGYPTVISDLQASVPVTAFPQIIVDYLNFSTLYLRTRNNYQIQSLIDDPWDGFTLVFSFNKILPFFGFYDVKLKGENESKYILLYGGILDADSASQFFNMNPANMNVVPAARDRRVPQIPVKSEKEVEQNGVSIRLDENWQYSNNPELPGFWLPLATIRDSQIAIERANLRRFSNINIFSSNYFMFFKYTILNAGNTIEMNTVKIQEAGNGYQMECYITDSNARNYFRTTLVLRGNDLIIINFSTFADIYENNKDYYEKIFASVRVNR